MIIRMFGAAVFTTLLGVGAASAQSTVFEGVASIESQTAGCGGVFDLGSPAPAAFRPANIGNNGSITQFSFSPDGSNSHPRVSAESFTVSGPLAASGSYAGMAISGSGGSMTFSGTYRSASVAPALLTPTTPTVNLVVVINNARGLPGCTIRVRAGLVNSAG